MSTARFSYRHLIGLAALAACLGTLRPIGAQPSPRSAVAQIRSIELVDVAGGQELRVGSSGTFEQVAVQFFRERGIVVQIPAHRPAVGVEPLEFASGLVAAVDVELDERGDRPATRLVVRTRGPMTQALASEGSQLKVRIRPAGTPDLAPPTTPVAAPQPVGDRGLELETLEATLARSNQARSELAARLEGLAAEREAVEQRLGLVEERHASLEAELGATRDQAERQRRQSAQTIADLEGRLEQATLTEGELRRRIDDLEAARTSGEAERGTLADRLSTAEAEVAALREELSLRRTELATASEEAARRDAEAASQANQLATARAEIDRLERELATTTGELGRRRQKEFARLKVGELEAARSQLATELAAERRRVAEMESDAESAAARIAELEGELAATALERSQLASLAASTAADREDTGEDLERARQETAELERRVATLEAQLAAAQAETGRLEQDATGESEAFSRRIAELEGRLEEAMAEGARLTRELEAARSAGNDRAVLASDLAASEDRSADLEAQLETARRALIDSESRRRALEERVERLAATAQAAPGSAEPAGEPLPRPAVEPARTSTKVNMRSDPGTEFGIVALLPAGTPVEVVDESGEWIEIRVGEETGWIFADYLLRPSPSPE